MGFNFITKLPTPAEIRAQYPVSERVAKIKEERDGSDSENLRRRVR